MITVVAFERSCAHTRNSLVRETAMGSTGTAHISAGEVTASRVNSRPSSPDPSTGSIARSWAGRDRISGVRNRGWIVNTRPHSTSPLPSTEFGCATMKHSGAVTVSVTFGPRVVFIWPQYGHALRVTPFSRDGDSNLAASGNAQGQGGVDVPA